MAIIFIFAASRKEGNKIAGGMTDQHRLVSITFGYGLSLKLLICISG
jgi:hypothetical protein